MNIELRKAITDLGVLERTKGVDALETILFRERLRKAVKEMSRRGLFTFAQPKPAPESQLPATAPQHNDPATQVNRGLDPTRPSGSHTLLDRLQTPPSRPGSVLNPELSRREFTQRAAVTGARLAMGPLGGGPNLETAEQAHITAARKLVSDFVGSGDYMSHPDLNPTYAKQLIEAFKTHPDYKHEDIRNPPDKKEGTTWDLFTHKGGEHEVQLWHGPAHETRNFLTGETTPRPEAASASTNPYIHTAEDHPDYDQALTEKAHDLWNRHNQGEDVYSGGHAHAVALTSGHDLEGLEEGKDTDGNPIQPHKLYSHDWYNTGEITPVESSTHVKAVLHDQMKGGMVRKGENIRKWMDDPSNYAGL